MRRSQNGDRSCLDLLQRKNEPVRHLRATEPLSELAITQRGARKVIFSLFSKDLDTNSANAVAVDAVDVVVVLLFLLLLLRIRGCRGCVAFGDSSSFCLGVERRKNGRNADAVLCLPVGTYNESYLMIEANERASTLLCTRMSCLLALTFFNSL